ncbi:MAG: FAD-dependent oxidoreductase [Lachnospiraceae bacterium]|nr:FAD-dependent oxidoreductase [Lachnospiraceae bacterium]
MFRINELKLPVTHTKEDLEAALSGELGLGVEGVRISYEIERRSLDCRKKPDLFYSYRILVKLPGGLEKKLRQKNRNKRLAFLDKKEEPYQVPQLQKNDHSGPESGIVTEFGKEDTESRPRLRAGKSPRIIIVGDGPAGLFCAYILTLAGVPPLVLERGLSVSKRTKRVEEFWKTGRLDPECNVQFGEGGAGTFSDGKLNSSIRDKAGRIPFVLKTFTEFGAKEEIVYEAKPHLGTDELKRIIPNMREFMEKQGCEFRFGAKVTDLVVEDGAVRGVQVVYRDEEPERLEAPGPDIAQNTVPIEGASQFEAPESDIRRNTVPVKEKSKVEFIEAKHVVLAIGHSARDTFQILYDKRIPMEQKDFAVGFRVMHPQKLIDRAQYGAENLDKGLPAADYKLTHTAENGRRVYSFCMCPGGYVVNASSEKGRLAVNGMSDQARDSGTANSAVVAAVTKEDFGSESPLSGLEFQRRLEERAYRLAEGKVPIERYAEFRAEVLSGEKPATEDQFVSSGEYVQIKGQFGNTDLSELLAPDMNEAICEAMECFDRIIPGFAGEEAVLAGIESRTSSPVRILRDPERLMSNLSGLYPCGEGAGYAGGIMSAAVDGIRVAEKVIQELSDL